MKWLLTCVVSDLTVCVLALTILCVDWNRLVLEGVMVGGGAAAGGTLSMVALTGSFWLLFDGRSLVMVWRQDV